MIEITKLFNEDGHLNEEGVALFVDALKLRAVKQLPEPVRRHAEDCVECKTNITGVFSLLQEEDYGEVRSHPSLKVPSQPTQFSVSPILRIAAILAGVLLVGSLGYYLITWNGGRGEVQGPASAAQALPESTIASQGKGADTRGPHSGEFAVNFTPNPEFEGLVNGGMRSEELTGVMPANGAEMRKEDVRFRWRSESGEKLTLTVFDNRGRVLFSTAHARPPVIMPVILSPGLYYWKLMNEEEGKLLRKFFVR